MEELELRRCAVCGFARRRGTEVVEGVAEERVALHRARALCKNGEKSAVRAANCRRNEMTNASHFFSGGPGLLAELMVLRECCSKRQKRLRSSETGVLSLSSASDTRWRRVMPLRPDPR